MRITAGWHSFKKPTPSGIMFWTDVYLAMAGQFIAWIKSTDLVGHHAADITSEILGQTLMYVIILRKFFGVETSQKTVPISQVDSMNSDAIKMLYLVFCYDVIRYILF